MKNIWKNVGSWEKNDEYFVDGVLHVTYRNVITNRKKVIKYV